ncbi:MAG: hypothetical protein ABSC47_05370 [Terracidiphilus sp.]
MLIFVIWQTGSWQRSLSSFHKAAEIARNGQIGNVVRVEVGLPGGHHDFPGTVPALMQRLASLPDKIGGPAEIVPGTPAWDLAVTQPPPELDYDLWLGPSKGEPYIEARVYQNCAGTTIPAAASCWTGSATTATLRTVAWASILPARRRLKATASFRRPMPYGTRPRLT